MMQTLEEKMEAIASVMFLLPDHYTAIRIGRHGLHFVNELEQSDTPAGWKPRVPEEFEGWPIEEVKAWFSYQRRLSHKYRLWPVGLALQKLEQAHPEQAAAVKVQCCEIPPPNWFEPDRVDERCREGLLFMARDIPGDVPWFQEAVVRVAPKLHQVARDRRIVEMHQEGIGKKKIAAELRCSLITVKAVLRGHEVRDGRTVSAGS